MKFSKTCDYEFTMSTMLNIHLLLQNQFTLSTIFIFGLNLYTYNVMSNISTNTKKKKKKIAKKGVGCIR